MKFKKITFKCWYNTYYNRFEFWSPNCSAVKNHYYDKIYKTATDIRHDVIADLKKEYFLSDDDIKLIDQKIFAALAKICSVVGY